MTLRAITATWDEPASLTGSSGYYIEYVPTSGTTETYSTSYNYTSHTQYGLTNDIEYTVRVRVNRDGCPWSDSKKATPKAKVLTPCPSLVPVPTFTLESGFRSITVHGLTRAHFVIEYNSGTSDHTTDYYHPYYYISGYGYKLTGLVNGTTYTVKVSPTVPGRPECEYNGLESKATPQNECSPPRDLTLTPSLTSIKAKWGPPQYDGGVSTYHIKLTYADRNLRQTLRSD